jgi:DUF1365 family protein
VIAPPEARTLTSLAGVYEGTVWHERFESRARGEPGNRFSYPVSMTLVDVAHPERALDAHPLWSARRVAPKWFRRSDYFGDAEVPLDEAVRDAVATRIGKRPGGAVLLLTQLRTWGVQFNPISCYYCLDESDGHVEAMLAEVTNTPWHERHHYVVGPPGSHELTKEFHVSPFFSMGQSYLVEYDTPGESLEVAFDVIEGDERRLTARLAVERRGATRSDLSQALWHHPAGTMRTSAGIYRQAARLWLAGARFHPHPDRR